MGRKPIKKDVHFVIDRALFAKYKEQCCYNRTNVSEQLKLFIQKEVYGNEEITR
jgi:hypothetical protein